MLTAYNLNRNPRNLSTLTVPEYPVIDGEKPERYRTSKQVTALDGSGDRIIDAQEAMKQGFDMEKHITFRQPGGMNPFADFSSTGRINKLDRFIFDFGHLSDKNKPENQQRRDPFNMPSGIQTSSDIDIAPAQRYTPVHRLRRRQDTQTLVTPLYSEVASASTAHLSKLVSNKRMLENRDGTTINTTKIDPLAGNKNYGDESRAAAVKKVSLQDVKTQQIDAGHESTYRHYEPINTKYYDRFNPRDRERMLVEAGYDNSQAQGITEARRTTADIRSIKELERRHVDQEISAGKRVDGNFKTTINLNPDLLQPRREFMKMQARKETGYRTQIHDRAGKFTPDEKINYIPESNIRRQAGYQTDFRLDTTTRQRDTEKDKHFQRMVLNVDSKLTNDYSDKFQVRADESSVSDPRALRQYDMYPVNARAEPDIKPVLEPDIPDTMDRMVKTIADQDIHSGGSNPGTSRDMFSGGFRLTSRRGRESINF